MRALVVAVATLLCLGGGLPTKAEAAWQRHEDDNGVIYYREAPVVVDATADPKPRHKTRRSTGSAPTGLKSSPGRFKPSPNKRYQRVQRERRQAEARQRKRCERYRRELDKVEQSLNAGYREPRGNQLRRHRRELESALFEQCR